MNRGMLISLLASTVMIAGCNKTDSTSANSADTQFVAGRPDPGPTPEPKEKVEPRDPATGETASEKKERQEREKEREKNPGGCNVSGRC